MNQLRTDGYVVIPVMEANLIRIFREAFVCSMTVFPEFRRDPDDPTRKVDERLFGEKDSNHVMGGFGAFGNPASFHNPFVRNIRILLRRAVIGLFRDLVRDDEEPVFMEQLFNRMCLRPAGTSTTRGSSGTGTSTPPPSTGMSCSAVGSTSMTSSRDQAPASSEKVVVPPGHLLIFLPAAAPRGKPPTAQEGFVPTVRLLAHHEAPGIDPPEGVHRADRPRSGRSTPPERSDPTDLREEPCELPSPQGERSHLLVRPLTQAVLHHQRARASVHEEPACGREYDMPMHVSGV